MFNKQDRQVLSVNFVSKKLPKKPPKKPFENEKPVFRRIEVDEKFESRSIL